MSKKDKFTQTKDIIRIALNSGMTQDDIAKKCRVQQPQVSKWKNGAALASKAQVQPLLELFGEQLRRHPFELFAHETEDSVVYVKVEGQLLLREVLFRTTDIGVQSTQGNELVTAVRFSLLRQTAGHYCYVMESCCADFPWERPQSISKKAVIHLQDRHAVWNVANITFSDGSPSRKFLLDGTAEDVLSIVDYASDALSNEFKGFKRLPFLVREAFLRHGITVGNIDVIKIPL